MVYSRHKWYIPYSQLCTGHVVEGLACQTSAYPSVCVCVCVCAHVHAVCACPSLFTLHSRLLSHSHSSGRVGLLHHLLMTVVQVKHLGAGGGGGAH